EAVSIRARSEPVRQTRCADASEAGTRVRHCGPWRAFADIQSAGVCGRGFRSGTALIGSLFSVYCRRGNRDTPVCFNIASIDKLVKLIRTLMILYGPDMFRPNFSVSNAWAHRAD